MIDFLLQYSHELAVAMAIIVTPISQVILRFGARGRDTTISTVLNPFTILGYALFAGVVLLMIHAMREIPLHTVVAWNSLSFILTPLAGWLALGDPYAPRMAVGSLIIVMGVVVFAI